MNSTTAEQMFALKKQDCCMLINDHIALQRTHTHLRKCKVIFSAQFHAGAPSSGTCQTKDLVTVRFPC